ncbi:MAG: hypothetical protein L6Q38_06160, partial [Nitrospira sp.]|nr:hypothetical protein [Nitrospira sp.]
ADMDAGRRARGGRGDDHRRGAHGDRRADHDRRGRAVVMARVGDAGRAIVDHPWARARGRAVAGNDDHRGWGTDHGRWRRAGSAGEGGTGDGAGDKTTDGSPPGVAMAGGGGKCGNQRNGKHTGDFFGIHGSMLFVSVG